MQNRTGCFYGFEARPLFSFIPGQRGNKDSATPSQWWLARAEGADLEDEELGGLLDRFIDLGKCAQKAHLRFVSLSK